jgi:hypothetical protein
MAPYTVRTKRLDKLWQNPHFGAAGDEFIASGSTDLPYGLLGQGVGWRGQTLHGQALQLIPAQTHI